MSYDLQNMMQNLSNFKEKITVVVDFETCIGRMNGVFCFFESMIIFQTKNNFKYNFFLKDLIKFRIYFLKSRRSLVFFLILRLS